MRWDVENALETIYTWIAGLVMMLFFGVIIGIILAVPIASCLGTLRFFGVI